MASVQLDDKAIFNVARMIDSPRARAEYLEQVCADDAPRRERIIDLLRAYDHDQSFMEVPSVNMTQTVDTKIAPCPPGTVVGPYKIREQIGEGGMGVVYAAEQTVPIRRKVALKLIKPGRDTKEVIARFEAERQALAMMNHPNIARVLDAGTTANGQPYFVMELVRGIAITDYCDQAKLDTRQRLELFATVCEAVQHAHHKGIIHRDIKPSNILVTRHDGMPVVKVIDFGVAKALHEPLTDKSLYTGFAQMLGTPKFMSPEQVELSGLDVDTRSDIYSLGVLLYRMLTGRTPLDFDDDTKRSFDEMRRQIREVNPPRPSSRFSTMKNADLTTIAERRQTEPQRLSRELRGDLDWIVMKALEKDRTRRYETANGFAMDIKRYLNNEPVTAVAPSTAYLLKKYILRHKNTFAAATMIFGLLVTGTVVSTWLAVRATNAEGQALAAKDDAQRQRDDAQAAQRKADEEKQRALLAEQRIRRVAYASDMNLAARELSRGSLGRARELLDRYRPGPTEADLRGWEWRYLWQQSRSDPHETLCQMESEAGLVSVSHDGRYVAACAGGLVRIWDLSTRSEIANSPIQARYAMFSPTEPLLAYWCDGDEAEGGSPEQGFRLWDYSRQETRAILPMTEGFDGIAFSADGATFAAANAGWNRDAHRLNLWAVADGKPIRESLKANMVGPGAGFPFSLAGDLSIAVHGTGGARQSTVRVIDLTENGKSWESAPVRSGEWVECMALSPDNRLLAVGLGTVSPEVQIWEATQDPPLAFRLVKRLPGHHAYVRDVLFVDDRTLASASADQTVRLWDLSNLDNIPNSRVFRAHVDEVSSLAILPDKRTLVSGCRNGSVFLWDISAPPKRETAHFTFNRRGNWSITEDETAMISCNDNGNVSRWTGPRYEVKHTLFSLGTGFHRGCVSGDATKIASGYTNGTIKIWDVVKRKVIQEFEAGGGPVWANAFLANNEQIQVSVRNTMSIWNWKQRELIKDWSDPPGKRLLSSSGNVCVTKTKDGTLIRQSLQSNGLQELPSSWPVSRWSTNLSSDGNYLASSTYGAGVTNTGQVNVWDLNTQTKVGTFGQMLMSVHGVSFSPDVRRLAASSGSFEAVKLWDFDSQQEVLTLAAEGGPLRNVRFGRGGNVISANDEGGVVYCWRAPSREEIATSEAQRE
jgi:serine/threonine protein kinase/WD40 repeat protein